MRVIIIYFNNPNLQLRNRDTERLSNFTEAFQLVSNRAGI